MSKPRGTLKYRVGEISRRFATVLSIRPGTGLPSSTYRVPPWARIMLKPRRRQVPPSRSARNTRSGASRAHFSRNSPRQRE
ncbi:MAG: hypothetical protein AB1768_04305 [Pseudomonadota bacterium]